MSSPALAAFIVAVIAAVIAGVLNLLRETRTSSSYQSDYAGLGRIPACITTVALTTLFLFFFNWLIFYFERPTTTLAGLWPTVVIDLIFILVATGIGDAVGGSLSAAPVVVIITLFGCLGYLIVANTTGVTNNGDAQKLAHQVHVVREDPSKIPNTNTDHMVIVSNEVASYKANQALSSGAAGKANINTYFNLGSPALEYVDGHMWYIFQLKFDGSGNKHRQHNIAPGYVMVDAENPDAEPVQRIGAKYSMVIGVGNGQQEEVSRWVYQHGYSSYKLDDPILEINDQGHPYFTVTLERPVTHWTNYAPVGVLLVDATDGSIKRYAANGAPSWVDRVYSSQMAATMVNWWGDWGDRKYKLTGKTHANQFRVSGDPQLVYTTGGHPSWRMLMTSHNNDSSVNYVVLFDARSSNNVRVYTPQNPISTEEAVTHSFETASTGNIRANGYKVADLSLHMIYGRLTWVASYASYGSGDKATYQGIGLLNAYDNNGAGVIFADNKADALANYQTQIATGTDNNAPEQGGQKQSVTGTVVNETETVEGGQTYVYLMLKGDTKHVYRGKAGASSPELNFSKVGDPVTVTFLNVGTPSVRNISSFDDSNLQLTH